MRKGDERRETEPGAEMERNREQGDDGKGRGESAPLRWERVQLFEKLDGERDWTVLSWS